MKKWHYHIIGLIAMILSFMFDKKISIFFTSHRINFLDVISIFINGISGYILFGFILLIFIVAKQKKRLLPLIITFVLYLGLTGLLKIIVARPRPFVGLNNSLVDNLNQNRSFPSGHAVSVFSLVRLMDFNKIIFYLWILIAIVISISRVYLGVHYLSDVIAGALIGLLIGELVSYTVETIYPKLLKSY